MLKSLSNFLNKYQIINNFKILHTFNDNIFLNSILFPGILHCAAHARPIALAIFTPCLITPLGPWTETPVRGDQDVGAEPCSGGRGWTKPKCP